MGLSDACTLQLIPEELVRAYRRAMLNIHPALLPAFGGKGFYGARVHGAVIASGARFSGPTIHFVDEGWVVPTPSAALASSRALPDTSALQ